MSWIILPHERLKYEKIFEGLIPVNGLLSGNKVKPILLNSKLPLEVLGKVWELSDLNKDGFLNLEEFVIAMHLVYKALDKIPVPPTLPPELLPSNNSSSSSLNPSNLSSTPPNAPNIITKITITPTERAHYDDLFATYDLDKDGFLNGNDVKEVFLQSGLPQLVLAHIWNLCDTLYSGKLNKDQFCLAMHLMQQKVKGYELPSVITQDMLPHSIQLATQDNSTTTMDFASDPEVAKQFEELTEETNNLKSEKIQLEKIKNQKDADLLVEERQITNLQIEIDQMMFSNQQIESQKVEAQKKLNELEDKKIKLTNSLSECTTKLEMDQLKIQELKNKMANNKPLTEEEEMKKIEKSIEKKKEENKKLQAEYNGLISKEKKYNEKINQLENKIQQFSAEPNLNSQSTTSNEKKQLDDRLFNDNFLKNDDPFQSAETDPFSTLQSNDPFGEDPFKESFPQEEFLNHPPNPSVPLPQEDFANFSANFDSFPIPLSTASNISTSDPWTDTQKIQKDLSLDDFDPFGCKPSKASNFQFDSSDPFGTGSFQPLKPSSPPKSPQTPQPLHPPNQTLLPPRRKSPAPPRPPAPNPVDDPQWAKPPKLRTEAEQLAWAEKDSKKEFERLKRMKEQEEADIQLAIALSKQDMK